MKNVSNLRNKRHFQTVFLFMNINLENFLAGRERFREFLGVQGIQLLICQYGLTNGDEGCNSLLSETAVCACVRVCVRVTQ